MKNVQNSLYHTSQITYETIEDHDADITNITNLITNIQNDITTIEGDIISINNTLSGLTGNYELASGTITATTPSDYGPTAFYLVRNYKQVTLLIYSKTKLLTTNVPEIVFGSAIPNAPTNFRPVQETYFPHTFVSNNVYDTGLIGAVIIRPNGDIVFRRNLDASPSNFTGVSGWGSAVSLTYLIA